MIPRYSALLVAPGNNSLAKNFPYFTLWLFVLTLIWLAVYGYVFTNPIGLADSHWLVIAVGVFGAYIGNATAIGGGIIFIPVLRFAYQADPVSALTCVCQAGRRQDQRHIRLVAARRNRCSFLQWAVPALIIRTMMSA